MNADLLLTSGEKRKNANGSYIMLMPAHCASSFRRSTRIPKSNRLKFNGACIDTGAQKTVIGKKQARAYCQSQGMTMRLQKSQTAFKFGNGKHDSLGMIPIRIPTINGDISLEVDVVQPDVPLLLGLDVLDREQIVPDNVENILESRLYGWTMPITRRHGHMYLQWDTNRIMFTRMELHKLHRHFHHPSTGKLMALLKRSKLKDVDSSTKAMLQEISDSCSTCQTFSIKPQRFKVSLPNDKVIFNRAVALHLMWLDGHAAYTWSILTHILAARHFCQVKPSKMSGNPS